MARFRFAALGAALMIASATAGAQSSNQDHSEHRIRGSRGHGQGKAVQGMFRGVNLTEQQKSQVKQIHAKYRPQYEALGNGRDSSWKRGERGQRTQGDSATRAARRARAQVVMQQHQQLRQQEMNEIRGILTADQRVTFDQNVAQMKERVAKRGNDDRDDDDDRKGKGKGKGKGRRGGR